MKCATLFPFFIVFHITLSQLHWNTMKSLILSLEYNEILQPSRFVDA